MDKNTIIGLILIFVILIGFSYFTKPGKEEIAEAHRRDSIARVENQRKEVLAKQYQEEQKKIEKSEIQNSIFSQDSLKNETIYLDNSKIRIALSTLGGQVSAVEIKNYRRFDSTPLMLINKGLGNFGLDFYAKNSEVHTEKMLFRHKIEKTQEQTRVHMYLDIEADKYLEYIYTLPKDSYKVDFKIKAYNLGDVVSSNSAFITMNWGVTMTQLEKSKDFENRYTGIYYNFYGNDLDNMVATGEKEEKLQTKVKWIAYKQQFFSSILIADDAFNDVEIKSKTLEEADLLKKVGTTIQLSYDGSKDKEYNMSFLFLPNSYKILKEYGKDIELTGLLNLGWQWISWINKIVIYIFHFLEKYTPFNYGIIILLLTLIIKLVLSPLTYKSYVSQAKSRVLKPQLDEINKKYPNSSQAMDKQKATMELYKKAGVNPMGGCLPMLIQFPILIALFYFFPGAIELRQESFLWADDLASYDSIATLPFNIPFYGNHVSLFCLLMTIVNIIYMKMNNKNQPQNDQMKGMQTMMYIMPVMFLFIFNSYSAALSYYYLIATLITIVQTWIIRKNVNDEKLLQKIEMAKAKPRKKSNFQKRLEEMQKKQAERQRNR